MDNQKTIIKNFIADIKKNFKDQNIKILLSGSQKYGMNYKIVNSYRLQSDIDINFIFDFQNVPLDKEKEIYEEYLNKAYNLIIKHKDKEFKIKKFFGLIRIKFDNQIYDFSFLWQRDKELFSLDNMYGNIKISDVFMFEKRLFNFLENNQYGLDTLKYLKTFIGMFRVFEYRLPKGIFLTLLIMRFYNEGKNLEYTIFKTIESIYNYLLHNVDKRIFMYDKDYAINIKFSVDEVKWFMSLLKMILDQKKVTQIFDK